jgi:hypothetical protein
VTFAIPAGVATDVVFLDAGFNDLGESVSFTRLRPRTVTTVDPDGTIVKTKIVPEVAADGSFPIEVTTRFPVDREVMRSYGVRGSRIPLRITVVTNGELVVGEDGLPQVINGETFEVTGENWGTTVLARVAPGD